MLHQGVRVRVRVVRVRSYERSAMGASAIHNL